MSVFVHPHLRPCRAPVLQANPSMNTALKHLILYSSRKYPHPPQGRSLQIPRGREMLKANFLKENMKENCNFHGGGDANLTTLHWEWEYFLERHIDI